MTEYNGPERRNGLNHLKELFEAKVSATEKALELQAKEYERRLANLNGEASRLRDMQATYLLREIYEEQVKTHEAQHLMLNIRIDILQKMVFIGLGAVLAFEFISRFIKPG